MRNDKSDFNRVIQALHHQEVDRIPLAEVAVSYKTMSLLLGREFSEKDLL